MYATNATNATNATEELFRDVGVFFSERGGSGVALGMVRTP